MGILKRHIHIFCLEQEKYPVIKGDVLTLGQQFVYSTLRDVILILGLYNIPVKDLPTGFDTANKIPSCKGTKYDKYTNAQSLLTMLGADNVYAADVSAYENPDFLIDLNVPVKDSYHRRFDTILDVGTLEHVFDIAVALDNICKMLRKGGSVLLILPCSNAIDHGFYSFSPTLFFDYFNANGFASRGCYLIEGSPYIAEKQGRLFRYDRVDKECPLVSSRGVEVAFVATKESECDAVKPIQGYYRKSKYWSTGIVESNAIGRLSMQKRIKKFAKSFLSVMKDCYPFFVEKLIFGRVRGQNLKYLGKY